MYFCGCYVSLLMQLIDNFPKERAVNSNFKEKSTTAIFFYIEMLRARPPAPGIYAYIYADVRDG